MTRNETLPYQRRRVRLLESITPSGAADSATPPYSFINITNGTASSNCGPSSTALRTTHPPFVGPDPQPRPRSHSVARRFRVSPPSNMGIKRSRPGQLGTFTPLTRFEDLRSLSTAELLRYLSGHPGSTEKLVAEVPYLLELLRAVESDTVGLHSHDWGPLLVTIWSGVARLIGRGVLPPVCLAQSSPQRTRGNCPSWKHRRAPHSDVLDDHRPRDESYLPFCGRPETADYQSAPGPTKPYEIQQPEEPLSVVASGSMSSNVGMRNPPSPAVRAVTLAERYRASARVALECAARVASRSVSAKNRWHSDKNDQISNTSDELAAKIVSLLHRSESFRSQPSQSLNKTPWEYCVGKNQHQAIFLRPMSPSSVVLLLEMIVTMEQLASESGVKRSPLPSPPDAFPYLSFSQQALSQDPTVASVSGTMGLTCPLCGVRLMTSKSKLIHMHSHIESKKRCVGYGHGLRRFTYHTLEWFPITSQQRPQGESIAPSLFPRILAAVLPDIIQHKRSAAATEGIFSESDSLRTSSKRLQTSREPSLHPLFFRLCCSVLRDAVDLQPLFDGLCKVEDNFLQESTPKSFVPSQTPPTTAFEAGKNGWCVSTHLERISRIIHRRRCLPHKNSLSTEKPTHRVPFDASAIRHGCRVCGEPLTLIIKEHSGICLGRNCSLMIDPLPDYTKPGTEASDVITVDDEALHSSHEDPSLLPWPLKCRVPKQAEVSAASLVDRPLFPPDVAAVHASCCSYRRKEICYIPGSRVRESPVKDDIYNLSHIWKKRF